MPIVTFPNATVVEEATSVPLPDAATAGVVTIEPQPDSTIGSHPPATANRTAPHLRPRPDLGERRDDPERLEKKEEEKRPSGRRGELSRTACIYLTSNKKAFKNEQKRKNQNKSRRPRFLFGIQKLHPGSGLPMHNGCPGYLGLFKERTERMFVASPEGT
ncbi:MAG TPA: hypothetical protein VHX13_14075 [Acidobacteriaceae bacterium]|nr:hypothetical protein [Acidobacteriaceae bacterium]